MQKDWWPQSKKHFSIFLYCVHLWREKLQCNQVMTKRKESTWKKKKKQMEEKYLRRPCKSRMAMWTNGDCYYPSGDNCFWGFPFLSLFPSLFLLLIISFLPVLQDFCDLPPPSCPVFDPAEFSCIFYISANFQVSCYILQTPVLPVRARVPHFRAISKA